ncbi:MAG: Gx transporter family protein [Bacilli bacterium]|nr:Gx transporter family protein [Bacilli bacterium]MCI9434122.1 Gx transporter family protein [Bacilli bacterium]
MEIKKISRISMLLALSVVLNILESFIPLFNGIIPGFKLGLANIVILLVIYTYSFKDALLISLLRVFLVGILRTGLFSMSFFFSLGGSIISIIVMYLAKKITKLSIIGVSIMGSVSHTLGQIIVAIIFYNINMIYYTAWALLLSLPTGILVGYLTKEIKKTLDLSIKW